MKISKGTKVVLGSAAAVAAYFGIKHFTSLSSAGKAIQLKIVAFRMKGAKLYFDIQIFNPTKTAIKIDSIAGECLFNKKVIGNVQYFNQVPIAPLAYSKFKDVLVQLSPMGILTVATKIATRADTSGEFVLKGKTYLKGGLAVPFEEKVKAW